MLGELVTHLATHHLSIEQNVLCHLRLGQRAQILPTRTHSLAGIQEGKKLTQQSGRHQKEGPWEAGFEVCIGVPWGEEIAEESALPQREKQKQMHSCLLVL